MATRFLNFSRMCFRLAQGCRKGRPNTKWFGKNFFGIICTYFWTYFCDTNLLSSILGVPKRRCQFHFRKNCIVMTYMKAVNTLGIKSGCRRQPHVPWLRAKAVTFAHCLYEPNQEANRNRVRSDWNRNRFGTEPLGRDTIAEGIEHLRFCKYWKDIGCRCDFSWRDWLAANLAQDCKIGKHKTHSW